MKKITAVSAVILSALLCSCASTPDQTELSDILSQPYEAEATVYDNGDTYDVFVSQNGDAVSVKFCKPEPLSGVTYGFEADKSYIIYDDMTVPFDMTEAKDRLCRGVLTWKKLLHADKEYTVRGAGEHYVMTDGSAEYRFDKKTNVPVYIKSGDVTITFKDFRAKNDKTS